LGGVRKEECQLEKKEKDNEWKKENINTDEEVGEKYIWKESEKLWGGEKYEVEEREEFLVI
jgi:hypothetical protein